MQRLLQRRNQITNCPRSDWSSAICSLSSADLVPQGTKGLRGGGGGPSFLDERAQLGYILPQFRDLWIAGGVDFSHPPGQHADHLPDLAQLGRDMRERTGFRIGIEVEANLGDLPHQRSIAVIHRLQRGP